MSNLCCLPGRAGGSPGYASHIILLFSRVRELPGDGTWPIDDEGRPVAPADLMRAMMKGQPCRGTCESRVARRAAGAEGETSRQVISSCCDANSGSGLGSDRRVPRPA